MNNPEDSKPEEESENEDKPFVDEETSYSFLFFATSGALLFVTLWSFWDDEYSRRGYKQYQNEYFKSQYARAEDKWKEADKNIASKEEELGNSLRQVDSQLDDSDEYQVLLDEVLEAEIKLGELKELKKFSGS
ncbi:MAG TPA: cytochrome C, partial [Nitrospina sp.]|nr:cytochrome C [Nitrospina sp.]